MTGDLASTWNPDYLKTVLWRNEQLIRFESDPRQLAAARIYYAAHPIEFIEHWMTTYDPRRKPSRVPFQLFPRQRELVTFVSQLIEVGAGGLIEKARDMGATWVACAISVHLFLFREGAAVAFGSRKEQLVDKIGDPDSIFEKIRMLFRAIPAPFLPPGFGESSMGYMKIVHPTSGATITGEAGDNIGRGGRSLVYWLDEAAHIERPDKVEAALADNTNVQIAISSVNGLGNLFHRRREAGAEWAGQVVADRTNVFVIDWSDHPMKDRAWYERRRAKAESEGLMHVFEQEVNRNYAASVEGVLIPSEWVSSAIDAHLALGFEDDGGYVAGLDIADEGRDTNAQALRKGVVLRSVTEWSERDTGATARRSIGLLDGLSVSVQYDCIGVGAGVKAETNRLRDEGLISRGLEYVAWNSGAGVVNPDGRVNPKDNESPTNKDFYTNLKAQAGWELRRRFERTHRARTEGVEHDSEGLISIDSGIPLLRKLQKELSQATVGKGAKMKLLIDKTPPGTKSPNLADAVAMCYFPIPVKAPAAVTTRFVTGNR